MTGWSCSPGLGTCGHIWCCEAVATGKVHCYSALPCDQYSARSAISKIRNNAFFWKCSIKLAQANNPSTDKQHHIAMVLLTSTLVLLFAFYPHVIGQGCPPALIPHLSPHVFCTWRLRGNNSNTYNIYLRFDSRSASGSTTY